MTNEQILRFFNKQCTAAEAREVADYLNQRPEVLETYLSVHEWNTAEAGHSMPKAFWDQVWGTIEKRRKAAPKMILLKRTAVAASIAALLFIGYHRLYRTSSPALAVEQPVTKHLVLHKTEINRSTQVREIDLIDGSTVMMSPGAEIRYDLPFDPDKRDIRLDGEAVFNVAKDQVRPFTVYAGLFTTTALGTEFRVAANAGNSIMVKLISGKVVIRPIHSLLKGWQKDVYLLAGQQMRYDAQQGIVSVGNPNKIRPVEKSKPSLMIADNKNAVVPEPLSFDGSPLPVVMEKLSAYYQVKINYDTAEIKEMNFSGKISQSDSLPIVLKMIAQMNDLEIISDNKDFILRKKPE